MMSKKEPEYIIEVELDVPGGKLICGDYLGEIFDLKEHFDLNTRLGLKQATESYAKNKLLHGYVGNSCPSVYLDQDKIYIGHNGKKPGDKMPLIPGRKVGSVTTELWWYSIADYDEFVRRGGNPKDPSFFTIKVSPGRYVLRHKLCHHGGWENSPFVYATIEKRKSPPQRATLPEEGVAEQVSKLLPPGSSAYVQVSYAPKSFGGSPGAERRINGYEIWGSLNSPKESYSVIVKESDLKHPKRLVKKIMARAGERKRLTELLEKKVRNKKEQAELISLVSSVHERAFLEAEPAKRSKSFRKKKR